MVEEIFLANSKAGRTGFEPVSEAPEAPVLILARLPAP